MYPQQPAGYGWGTGPGGPPQGGLELVPIVVPPEPPHPPRKAPWRAIGWNARFMLIFGAGFGGIPTVIFAVMFATMGGPWDDWYLDDRGVRTTAEVYKVERTSTSINDETVMRLKVRFEDNKERRRKTSVTTLPPVPSVGDQIEIEYDPKKRKRARLYGESASPLGFLMFMPVLFGGVGIPLFFVGLVAAMRQRALYRKGKTAQARVVDVSASASRQNNRRVMIAHYSYQTPTGAHRGEYKTVDPPARDTVIWVLYDPERPQRSVAA